MKKILNITNQRNANQNHNEIPPYLSEWLSSKRTTKNKCRWGCGEKRTLVYWKLVHLSSKRIRNKLPTPVFLGFPCGSAGKESTCNAGDLGSIPALGRSPGEGKGYPFQYSGLENSMHCIVHGVAKSQTWLSDFHSLTHCDFAATGLCHGKIYPRTRQR